MDSEDSVSVNFGIILVIFTVFIVSGESGGAMRNIETSIAGSLHGSEHFVSDSGVNEADVENGLEGSSLCVGVFAHIVVFTVDVGVGGVEFNHVQLGQ